MKVVLLAGGKGTRITEESIYRPKPMVEIGGKPILWHIMKQYSHYGFDEFIVCAGYKQEYIKEWFDNYFLHVSDITYDFTDGKNVIVNRSFIEPWKVTIVDTGQNTMTGGRVKRIREYIGKETFMLTYGDAVCDVNISELASFHKSHGKKATMTSVIQKQEKGESPKLSAGKQNYDFLHIADVAHAFYLIAEKGINGTNYIIGSGEAKPLREYLEVVGKIANDTMGTAIPLGFGEITSNVVYLPKSVFSISQLVEDTGFSPTITFEEGIKRTVNWIVGQG